MRSLARILPLIAVLVSGGQAHAASQRDRDDCYKAPDQAQEIVACTRVIDDRTETPGNRAAAYTSRCDHYRIRGELDRAFADCSEAIRLDPKNARAAYTTRCASHIARRELDRGISDCSEAIKLDPNSAGRAYNNRCLAYSVRRELDRAIADCNEAIRLDPKLSAPFVIRANIYFARGDSVRALADFDHAIELDPRFGAAYSRRGLVFFAIGELKRAIADSDEALRIDASNFPAAFQRALVYYYAGQLATAQAELVELARRVPSRIDSRLWMEIVARRGHGESRLSEAVSKLDMQVWPAPLFLLFLGHLTQAEVLAAAAAEPHLEERQSKTCVANFYGGAFALSQGRKEEAGRLFVEAAGKCPINSILLAAAKAELRGLAGPQHRPVWIPANGQAGMPPPAIVNPDVEEYLRGRRR